MHVWFLSRMNPCDKTRSTISTATCLLNSVFLFLKTGGFIKVQIHTMALRTGCSPIATGTVTIPKYRTYTDLYKNLALSLINCIVKTTSTITIKQTLHWLARPTFQILYILLNKSRFKIHSVELILVTNVHI